MAKIEKKMKKGLMQSTIAVIIVILLSTAVLIVFLYNFTDLFTSQVGKDTCRASVELRSSSGLFGQVSKSNIPLRCKTEYYCLSMGGNCPEGYTRIKVDNIADIQREIAYRMYDCWWMLGEGNLNFFKREIGKTSNCVFCSQIAFDDKVKSKYKEVSGINSYLNTQLVPRKNISYWEYFTKQTGSAGNIISEGDKINTSEVYVVTYSLIEKSFLIRVLISGGIAGTLATGAGGVSLPTVGGAIGTIFGPGGTAIGYTVGWGASIATGAIVGKQINAWIEKNPSDYYVKFDLVDLKASSINEFGCTDIESIP
jgi:hypothetical protein